MRSTFILAATAGVLFSAVAFAEDATTPAQTAQTVDPDKIICKTMEPTTGTRLGSRRVCQTEHQWEQMQAASEKFTNDAQTRNRSAVLGQ